MVVETIKSFAKSKGFVQISPSVRTNINGYPFVTFIDGKNVAENVYFSKKAAQSVGAGTVITKELMSQYQITVTKNEKGEERVKLISNSERIDIADLLD